MGLKITLIPDHMIPKPLLPGRKTHLNFVGLSVFHRKLPFEGLHHGGKIRLILRQLQQPMKMIREDHICIYGKQVAFLGLLNDLPKEFNFSFVGQYWFPGTRDTGDEYRMIGQVIPVVARHANIV